MLFDNFLISLTKLLSNKFEEIPLHLPVPFTRHTVNNDTIKTNIRKLRIGENLTQGEMAEKVGMKLPSYLCVETGKVRLISKHVERIAGAFGLSTEELVNGFPVHEDAERLLREEQAAFQEEKTSLRQQYEETLRRKDELLASKEELIRSLRETIRNQEDIIKMLEKQIPGEK